MHSRDRALKQKLGAAWPALLGVLIPWTILIAYNLAVYGRPLEFGYSYEVEERFQEIMGLGLMGMRLPTLSAAYHISIDPKFGLLWLSPVLLLVPLGYWMAFRERRHWAEALRVGVRHCGSLPDERGLTPLVWRQRVRTPSVDLGSAVPRRAAGRAAAGRCMGAGEARARSQLQTC